MKFTSVFVVAMAVGGAVASPLLEVRQNAATLVQKIAVITADVAKLNNSVVGLKKGDILTLAKALIIQQQNTDLLNAINAATSSAAKIRGQLSEDDSNAVAGPILDLLGPIQVLLNNIVVKKPILAKAVFGFGDLSKTVLSDLKADQAATNKLGTTLVPKLSDNLQSIATSVVIEPLNGYFATAIAAYQKCTGLVCLPPIPIFTAPAHFP